MRDLPAGREKVDGVTAADTAPEPLLYTGIVLYSTEDPEASAMLVADGVIAWTGAESSARILHPQVRRVRADGGLVTPGFVDAAATADGSDPAPVGQEAASRGIVHRLPGPTGTRDGVRIIAPVQEDAPLRDLLRDGVPLAFGSLADPAARDPWSWVRAACETRDPSQRLSDRAAFLAASRGGWRAAGLRHPGSLRVGLPATFVVWEPWDLTVRSAAPEGAEWSTDPRARTPLLPDLAHGAPRALRTVVAGAALHDELSGTEA